MHKNSFHKSERLCSIITIERLFNGGSRSFSAFPIRIVYRLEEKEETLSSSDIKVLITVSKRHFHHAVDRNRVKRQIREAYRMHKEILHQAITPMNKSLSVAFIWQDDRLWESADINERVQRLLNRVADKISHVTSQEDAE